MGNDSSGAVSVKRRKDRRLLGLLTTLVAVLALGWGINKIPRSLPDYGEKENVRELSTAVQSTPEAQQLPKTEPGQTDAKEQVELTPLRRRMNERFQQAVVMLHAKRYEHALVALESVLTMDPNLPEAYLNAGFALIGLEQFVRADQAFAKAIDIRPELHNAYYGLAVALEGQGQIRAAIGAMQIYTHRADPKDPFYRKAMSAIWEWEEQLLQAQKSDDEATSGVELKAEQPVAVDKSTG